MLAAAVNSVPTGPGPMIMGFYYLFGLQFLFGINGVEATSKKPGKQGPDSPLPTNFSSKATAKRNNKATSFVGMGRTLAMCGVGACLANSKLGKLFLCKAFAAKNNELKNRAGLTLMRFFLTFGLCLIAIWRQLWRDVALQIPTMAIEVLNAQSLAKQAQTTAGSGVIAELRKRALFNFLHGILLAVYAGYSVSVSEWQHIPHILVSVFVFVIAMNLCQHSRDVPNPATFLRWRGALNYAFALIDVVLAGTAAISAGPIWHSAIFLSLRALVRVFSAQSIFLQASTEAGCSGFYPVACKGQKATSLLQKAKSPSLLEA